MKFQVPRSVLYPVIACIMAITGEAHAGGIRINHDGTMRASTQGMSLHGIGTSHIVTDDFSVRVRGQFRMLSSTKLIRQGRKPAGARPQAVPVWVSLVALGEIQLEIPGQDGSPPAFHRAKTAVYHVRDNRWVLDSQEIKP